MPAGAAREEANSIFDYHLEQIALAVRDQDFNSRTGALAGDGLPGEAARTPHFTQVVGLVWRTVALWLLLLVLLTLAHVLG